MFFYGGKGRAFLSFISRRCWGGSAVLLGRGADRGALVKRKEEGMSTAREGEKLVGG
ncbi:hypothetical protein [Bartonella kosoyi]|uniref:hypothetical protein n=1 Tax=Bartonella kosoyi TaxID=2133959 RepID=UPI0014256BAF|nr:hypothetical protein [Bartonella kosoyi]